MVCFPPFFSTSNWFFTGFRIYRFRRRFLDTKEKMEQPNPSLCESCHVSFSNMKTRKEEKTSFWTKHIIKLGTWSSLIPLVRMSHEAPAACADVSYLYPPWKCFFYSWIFFWEVFLSQLLYECSDRPTSPRMNPNSWRRVIVICGLLSACESGFHKEIITH